MEDIMSNTDWNPVVDQGLTNQQTVEVLVQECMKEISVAHMEKYDVEKAELTAAKFLFTRMKLSEFIGDIVLQSNQTDNEVSRVEAEKFLFFKSSKSNGEKITDAGLKALVTKNEEVVQAKQDAAEAEAALKRWNYLIDTLKDGFYYFKSIGKNKNDF